jgi:diaminohydroxyphosphoribosylaminopyrimidine deaminase / 5-amino-6-(5-phosphoribosylamino)uracil reductase
MAWEDRVLSARTDPSEGHPVTDEAAWRLLLELARGGRGPGFARSNWPAFDEFTDFVELYRPLCEPARHGTRVLAHLGQSIDGYIATVTGDSSYVNDPENIRHLHRLRALHDAVIVGAGTIAADNPQLTTRLVSGPNPVRVVLDPHLRLSATARVFNDDTAPTIVVTAETVGRTTTRGRARILRVPARDGLFDLAQVSERLAEHGLRKLFVEGGGTTVSRYFDAGLLDRLQIAVAPVLIGRGQPGLRLASNHSMKDCPRPPHRVFAMGKDLLFDCDLSLNAKPEASELQSHWQGTRMDRASAIRRIG